MVRVVVTNPLKYFEKELAQFAKYFAHGTSPSAEIRHWQGKAAKMLGLHESAVDVKSMSALARNRHPLTGEKLKPRDKSNNLIATDVCISSRKSVTLAARFDPRIKVAFGSAVHDGMTFAETLITTRVRKGGVKDGDRQTGIGIWATFIDDVTRPTKTYGMEELHLHAHNPLMHLTADPAEGFRWKAPHLEELKRNAPLIDAVFTKSLVRRLRELGYDANEQGELTHVPQSLIEKFSTRTKEINQTAKERGITDPKRLDKLGAQTRSPKRKDVSREELEAFWDSRGTPQEWTILKNAASAAILKSASLVRDVPGESLRKGSENVIEATGAATTTNLPGQVKTPDTAEKSSRGEESDSPRRDQHSEHASRQNGKPRTDRGEKPGPDLSRETSDPPPRIGVSKEAMALLCEVAEELLSRQSSVKEGTLIAQAINRKECVFSTQQLHASLHASDLIVRKIRGQNYVTSRAVLEEEADIVAMARNSRGTCFPLNPYTSRQNAATLTAEGKDAVSRILQSTDRFHLLEAKIGDETLGIIQKLATAIKDRDHHVGLLTLTSQGAQEMIQGTGIKDSFTVARFQGDKALHDRFRRGVLLVNEAAVFGTKTTRQLFALAKSINARLVLVSDPSQHRSVERGNIFSLLKSHAGLMPVRVNGKEPDTGTLRSVVEHLSSRRNLEALTVLERSQRLHKHFDESSAHHALGEQYVKEVKTGRSVLTIAGSNSERLLVTETIRSALKATHLLGRERIYDCLTDLKGSDLQRARSEFYTKGMIVQFNRHARAGLESFRAGQKWKVVGHDPFNNVLVHREGSIRALPLKLAARWQVFEESKLAVAKGDLIRITRGARIGKNCVTNGTIFTVSGFTPLGDLRVRSGRSLKTIPKDFSHFTHAYVVTPHTAPGKSADSVLFAASRRSCPAILQEHLNASVSRARSDFHLYTNDMRSVARALSRAGERHSALDLTGGDPLHTKSAFKVFTINAVRRASQYAHTLFRCNPSVAHQHELSP